MRKVSSVSDAAASLRDAAPHGAVCEGRGSLPTVRVFHRHACTTAHWGWEARSAAACTPGQWRLMVLRTFLRARRQRVPPTEAMASAAAEPSLGQRALLGVGRVQWAGERKQYLRAKLQAKPRHERVIQQAEFVSEQRTISTCRAKASPTLLLTRTRV